MKKPDNLTEFHPKGKSQEKAKSVSICSVFFLEEQDKENEIKQEIRRNIYC